MAEGSIIHGAAVRLDNVSRRYGSVSAVENVNLEVQPGEFVTLLGPSGSGKSTTLNILAGFDRASEGEVYVDERPFGGLPAHKRNIGMVFQDYALFPHLSVAENVAYPLRERRVGAAQTASSVREALATVKLEDFAERAIHQISGGQRQRVALARAIVFSPQILLMDEPLGALDKKLREQLQTELKELHRRIGVTVFFVTHDQEEAMALSDRIAVFNKGRIEQIGAPKQLWEKPSSPFVADFLGGSNLIPGKVVGDRFIARERQFAIAAGATDGDATLLVRPEFLRLSPKGEGTGANSLHGRLASTSFIGSARRLGIDCGPNGRFQVVEHIGAFSRADDGDEIVMSWDAPAGVVVPGVDNSVATVFQAA